MIAHEVMRSEESHHVCRSSGRIVFPVHVPEDMHYEIEIDSDAHKLPTTHTYIGFVRNDGSPLYLAAHCHNIRSTRHLS
jgi:hypothetical protein